MKFLQNDCNCITVVVKDRDIIYTKIDTLGRLCDTEKTT